MSGLLQVPLKSISGISQSVEVLEEEALSLHVCCVNEHGYVEPGVCDLE